MSQANGNEGGSGDRAGQLAGCLIALLGFDAAVSACRNNHWLGVLRKIEDRRASNPDLGLNHPDHG